MCVLALSSLENVRHLTLLMVHACRMIAKFSLKERPRDKMDLDVWTAIYGEDSLPHILQKAKRIDYHTLIIYASSMKHHNCSNGRLLLKPERWKGCIDAGKRRLDMEIRLSSSFKWLKNLIRGGPGGSKAWGGSLISRTQTRICIRDNCLSSFSFVFLAWLGLGVPY